MAKAKAVTEATEAKQVATTEENLPATIGEGSWGTEDVGNEDILLPTILAMQTTSDLVTSGQAKMGEFRSSLDGKLLSDGKQPIQFIAFHTSKVWMIQHNKKIKAFVPVTPENQDWAGEEIQGNVVIQRDKCMDFYVLRPEDVEKGEAFPYVIRFKRTSYNAGKKLSTFLAQLRMFKKPSASQVFELTGTTEKNDKGTFVVLDVNKSRAATDKELAAAWQWYTALKNSTKVKIDDHDVKSDAAEAAPPTHAGHKSAPMAETSVNV